MIPSLGREELFADRSRSGIGLCRAYSDLVDGWLRELFSSQCGSPVDVALVAVGGYGRAELCPQSDIDLVLLHRGRNDIGELAHGLWYPIWDEGLKLGHAVRTVREALALAASDLDTATALHDVRHLCGDEALTAQMHEQALALWRKRSKRWLATLSDRVEQRQRSAGEVAFLLEPDLKEGRGGLRDVHAIRWAEAADRVMFEGDDEVLTDAYSQLLAARVELHRRTGRPGDTLFLQEQDAVADALGDDSADELMARVAAAARTIAWRSDEVWDRINATLKGGLRWRSARDRPLGEGVLLRDGRVHLASDARPEEDPGLILTVAAAAARAGTRIDRRSLDRLADLTPPMPDPWPVGSREALVELLLAGHPAIDVIESLDQTGLWVRLLPEWEPNRSRPQRNAYHRFTVDRHLCETAAEAAGLSGRVRRPDLLMVASLLHDLGKGYPGDHTEVGVGLIRTVASRIGFPQDDVEVLATLVAQHLLLPDVATRRDLTDPATVGFVVDRVGTVETLELLWALTVADSLATGPAAWGTWKAELVADLVARAERHLRGETTTEPEAAEFPNPEQLERLEEAASWIDGVDDRLTVVSPDRPGLFSRVAGVLALHGLDVLDAAAYTHGNGMALETFRVESAFGPTIAWERVVSDVEHSLEGRLALDSRLRERARVYDRRRSSASGDRSAVVFDNDLSPRSTVLEVHAPDAVGLLYRITRAMADLDLDVRSAKVQTLGADVVDSFYIVDREGRKITDAGHLTEIERAILAVLEVLPPAHGASESGRG